MDNIILTIFYILAVPATVILILQTVLLLFGIGDSGSEFDFDADADVDLDCDGGFDCDHDVSDDFSPDAAGRFGGAGLQLFTVRGIIAFLAVGGWAGAAALGMGAKLWLAPIIAVAAGFLAMVLVAWFFKMAIRLQSSGNIRLSNAVGKSGEVYMTVPANTAGKGKINAVVQERYLEIDAVTQGDSELKFGQRVKVVGLYDANTVIVEAE